MLAQQIADLAGAPHTEVALVIGVDLFLDAMEDGLGEGGILGGLGRFFAAEGGNFRVKPIPEKLPRDFVLVGFDAPLPFEGIVADVAEDASPEAAGAFATEQGPAVRLPRGLRSWPSYARRRLA
ncbi:MAG: hypothetical protein GVY10_07505 [Verrucomicrobia bacterium]|nr:hypothetical protein [Verrucomicrobiota bacterium]